ncbi:MAG: NTP transferase domain-containing protein [Acidimicrobiales bacterium]
MASLNALVIATGTGEPLLSVRPKPIHLLCGRPMVSYVLAALAEAGVTSASVVTGPDGGWIAKRVSAEPLALSIRFVDQGGASGNVEAALIGLDGLDDNDDEVDLLLVPADIPLLRSDVVAAMIASHRATRSACTVMVGPAGVDVAQSASRVVLDRRGACVALTRTPDRVAETNRIGPEALGIFVVRRDVLAPVLRRIVPDPFTRQASLDAIVEVLADSGNQIGLFENDRLDDVVPVDSRHHLADAEAELRRRTNDYWMRRGVTMVDPATTYIDSTVLLGRDVTIFPSTMLQGATVVGDRSQIGPFTRSQRLPHRHGLRDRNGQGIEAVVGDECVVGRLASLGPGSAVKGATRTGPLCCRD